MIDYQNDWLYSLIFAYADRSWHASHRSTNTLDRQHLLISEWSDAADAHCRGETVRTWIRDDDGLNEISLNQYEQCTKRNNAIVFRFILTRFHISSNRKHVVYNQNETPRSGSGCRFIVEGKGSSAKLITDETAGMWIS